LANIKDQKNKLHDIKWIRDVPGLLMSFSLVESLDEDEYQTIFLTTKKVTVAHARIVYKSRDKSRLRSFDALLKI